MDISGIYSYGTLGWWRWWQPCQTMRQLLLLLLFASLSVLPAKAERLETEFARAELLAAVDSTGDLSEIQLGLKVTLQPGWKIYWRSPGDAGLPTQLSLLEPVFSEQKLKMEYPLPERFSLFGLDTYGYGEQVIFPVRLTGHPSGLALNLRANLDALVCSDICVPFNGAVALRLPAGPVRPSVYAIDIARASAQVPRETTGLGPVIHSVTYDQLQTSLYVLFKNTDITIDEIFVETDQSGLSFAQPVRISDGHYKIPVSGAVEGVKLNQKNLRFTVQSDDLFAEQMLTVGPETEQKPTRPLLVLMLLIALAGGLILNIMPCVLPVLFLKLASILSMTISQPRMIRLRLLTGAAGILSSFAVLTGCLVILKLTGARIGWGIQFQNLYFLTAMALILGIFTLILTDKISLPTPQFTNVTPSNSLSSDFLSGFLATLLATPCSAPLVGTAVSFALSADYAVFILILMTMGVGLAMPWLVLAIAPQLLLMLPKPGGWLAYVRPALASGLVLTIFWLLWLILLASSALFVVGITAGLLVIWLFSVFGPERFIWHTSIGIAAICISLTGWFNGPPLPADRQSHFIADGGIWQPFSPQLLAELKSQKQATFVDVTAEWCVTCKLNKQLVLEQEPVLQAFAKSDVVLLRADWTRPDDMIADYLLEYDRFGIPFNSLYLPGRAEPIIFSEILSAEKILHALKNYLH